MSGALTGTMRAPTFATVTALLCATVVEARPRMGASDEEFAEFFRARQDRLMGVAYLLTGDRSEAEDLLQTSMVKMYLAWDRVRERGSVDAYVRRIMVNESTSLWRRGRRRREQVTDFAAEQAPEGSAVEPEYDEGFRAAVWDVVSTLPRKARAVVALRYYEGLSEAETAEVLGISVGTVKSQSSRALAALRERTPAGLRPWAAEEEQ